jgi:hypothetical protein
MYNKAMSRKVNFITPRNIIGLALAAIIIVAGVIIFSPKQTEFPLSELERISLEERSAKAANYLEELDRNEGIDKNAAHNPIVNDYPLDRYIAFALEYNYNENDKTELTVKEIKKFLESVFDAEFKEEEINNVGISPLLLDKNVNHDPVGKVYSIQKTTDKRQIAAIPITKYIRKNTYTNKEKTVYTIVYDKYTAKSPYDVLPHIDSANTKDYLEGKGKITTFKNAITAESAKEITQPEKETSVEYIVKDGKLIIKSIK